MRTTPAAARELERLLHQLPDLVHVQVPARPAPGRIVATRRALHVSTRVRLCREVLPLGQHIEHGGCEQGIAGAHDVHGGHVHPPLLRDDVLERHLAGAARAVPEQFARVARRRVPDALCGDLLHRELYRLRRGLLGVRLVRACAEHRCCNREGGEGLVPSGSHRHGRTRMGWEQGKNGTACSPWGAHVIICARPSLRHDQRPFTGAIALSGNASPARRTGGWRWERARAGPRDRPSRMYP